MNFLAKLSSVSHRVAVADSTKKNICSRAIYLLRWASRRRISAVVGDIGNSSWYRCCRHWISRLTHCTSKLASAMIKDKIVAGYAKGFKLVVVCDFSSLSRGSYQSLDSRQPTAGIGAAKNACRRESRRLVCVRIRINVKHQVRKSNKTHYSDGVAIS